jgi:hypothetical protein
MSETNGRFKDTAEQTNIEAIVPAAQRYMCVSRSGDPSDQGS